MNIAMPRGAIHSPRPEKDAALQNGIKPRKSRVRFRITFSAFAQQHAKSGGLRAELPPIVTL
jgi:hypothetical protein